MNMSSVFVGIVKPLHKCGSLVLVNRIALALSSTDMFVQMSPLSKKNVGSSIIAE